MMQVKRATPAHVVSPSFESDKATPSHLVSPSFESNRAAPAHVVSPSLDLETCGSTQSFRLTEKELFKARACIPSALQQRHLEAVRHHAAFLISSRSVAKSRSVSAPAEEE